MMYTKSKVLTDNTPKQATQIQPLKRTVKQPDWTHLYMRTSERKPDTPTWTHTGKQLTQRQQDNTFLSYNLDFVFADDYGWR